MEGFERVWLVLSHETISGLPERARRSRLIQASLQDNYSLPAVEQFTGIKVLLFDSKVTVP